MDNVKLYSNKVWIAEDQSDPDALIAKIVICDFSVNKNGVMLNRQTIDEWMSSLVNAPLVGKIKAKSNGEIDFTSHNATIVMRIDEETGEEYADIEFNTDAFGTFIAVEIEEIDGVECIVATAKVWKRFYDASKLIVKRIKEGTLSTSWEISVEKSNKKIMQGSLVKVIDKGRFIGHALLSEATAPAYDISRVLEVATTNEDEELCSAIIRDVMSMNDTGGNEVQKMDEENKIVTSEEGEENSTDIENQEIDETSDVKLDDDINTDDVDASEKSNEIEKSELTLWDLRLKIEESVWRALDAYPDMVWIFPEAHLVWAHVWDSKETDLFEFTYAVENDEVTLSEPAAVSLVVAPRNINSTFDEKNSALIDANKKIDELSSEIAALAPYKDAAEKAEREAAEAKRQSEISELRIYVEDSRVFTKEELVSEEISTMIESLKTSELKSIIADRIVEKAKKGKPETATAKQAKEKVDISSVSTMNPAEIFKNFVHGK